MRDIYAGHQIDTLVTGEAVTLDLPAASVALRAVSGLIDVFAALVLLLAAAIGIAFLPTSSALTGVWGVLAVVLALIVLPTALETATRGKSLGKWALGLRTVRDDGGPISFHHAFMRALLTIPEVWVLSGVPALVAGMATQRGKRLGDLLAGTYVVRERFALQLPLPVSPPPGLVGWARRADLAPLPDSLALAVRSLLARTSTLPPSARSAVAGEVAAQVAAYVSPAPPPGTPPEAFLAAVVAERRDRDLARFRRDRELRERLGRSAPRDPSPRAGQGPSLHR